MAAMNKPEPLARVRARKKREKAKARAECIEVVWHRERGHCQQCVLNCYHCHQTAHHLR